MLPLQWQLYILLCIFWRALWRPGMTAASPKAGVVWDCWGQSLGRVLAVIREPGHGSPPWPFLGAVWLHYDIKAITGWEQNARTGVPSPHGPCSAAQSLFCWCPEQDGCGRQSWLSSLANLLSLAASCVPEGAPSLPSQGPAEATCFLVSVGLTRYRPGFREGSCAVWKYQAGRGWGIPAPSPLLRPVVNVVFRVAFPMEK